MMFYTIRFGTLKFCSTSRVEKTLPFHAAKFINFAHCINNITLNTQKDT